METAFVQANGLRFAYLEQGKGPLVLMMHGFPDTAYTWDKALPAVAAAGFRAVAPFMRGYHPTEIPTTDPTADDLGADVIALIEALGETSAVVVGHDWGASAAYVAAITAPERVRLLVTLAIPHPRSVRPTPALAWKVRHFLALKRKNAAAKMRATDFAYADTLVKRWSRAWDVPAGETDRVKAAFREPGCVEAAVGYYRAQKLRVTGTLAKPVTVPAVSFAGETDLIAPRVYEKARHLFTSSYEVVQMPGGHFMHRENSEQFTTELVRILREKAKT